MRKFAFAAMLALAAGIMAAPAVMADSHEDGEKKITVNAEVRSRWEYIENVMDFTDSEQADDGFDDAFDFWPYRVRVGVMGQFSKDVSGYIELQNYGNFGNKSPHNAYGDPIYQSAGEDLDSTVQLYQAYINLENIGGSAFGVKVGRQEHTLGKELMLGDLDYYNGQSFDGARAAFDWEKVELDIFYYNIMERNAPGIFGGVFFGACAQFPGDSYCEDETANLYGVSVDINVKEGWNITPYALYYRDPVSADVFNSPSNPLFFYFTEGVKTWTYGVSFSKDRNDESLLDWNLEVAAQSGDVGVNDAMLDHSASVIEGWMGFNLGSERNHRLHVGVFMSSGDEDLGDQDAEGFFPLFPDHHSYNRLGDLDFGGQTFLGGVGPEGLGSGLESFNVGYTGYFGNHTFGVAYHQFMAAEAGLNSFIEDELTGIVDEDDLGAEIDLTYEYMYSSNVTFGVNISDFMPGDAFEAAGAPNFLQDDALRVAGQVRLRF